MNATLETLVKKETQKTISFRGETVTCEVPFKNNAQRKQVEVQIIKNFVSENPTLSKHEIAETLNINVARLNKIIPTENILTNWSKVKQLEPLKGEAKDKIEEFIIRMYPYLTNAEMVSISGYSTAQLSAFSGSLVKRGILNKDNKALSTEKLLEIVNKENTYYNTNGKKKEEARQVLYSYIKEANLNGLILSLPFHTCKFEKALLEICPDNRFIGVEMNYPTFLMMAKNIHLQNLPIEPRHNKIEKVIETMPSNTLAHAYIDLTGTLTKYKPMVETAIKNNIVKVGGIISFTFLNALRVFDEELKDLFDNSVRTDGKSKTTITTNKYFESIIGDNYELCINYEYFDTSPMALVILKRIK